MYKTTFTLAEAADLLRCHKETLRRAILDGSLQAAKLGRSYRISRLDLQTFWTERGGGELFDKNELLLNREEIAQERKKTGVKSRKNSDGPHQLTLPTD